MQTMNHGVCRVLKNGDLNENILCRQNDLTIQLSSAKLKVAFLTYLLR